MIKLCIDYTAYSTFVNKLELSNEIKISFERRRVKYFSFLLSQNPLDRTRRRMVRHKDFYQKYKTTNPIAAGKHRAPRSSFVEELDKARNPELKARSNSVLSDEAFRSVVHLSFNLQLLPDNWCLLLCMRLNNHNSIGFSSKKKYQLYSNFK